MLHFSGLLTALRMQSVKVRLFLRYLFIALIPISVLLLMGTISIVINERFAARQIRESNQRTLAQISNSVDFIFQELDSLDIIFSTSSEFLLSLRRILASPALDFEQSKVLSAIQNFVNVSAYARPYVDSIYVYIQNSGERLITTTDGIVDLADFNDREWFDSYRQHTETETFWTERRVLNRLPGMEENRPIISIYRRIYPLAGLRDPGVVVLNIQTGYLSSFLENLKSTPEQKVEILDNAGKLVFSDFAGSSAGANAQGAGDAVSIEGTRYVSARLVSQTYGWTYLSLTPAAQFYEVSRSLRSINIAVVCLSVLIGSIITLYASRRSFRHIERVLDVVDASDRGAPMPAAPPKTDKGFSHITYSILRTFLEHEYLQVQLSERKYRQKTLELLALQSQMNPHFLFNTLETINWKIITLTRAPHQVNEMIHSLSNILKYALQSPTAYESLQNEIDHARDYLSIQGIRYKDKFSVVWDCSPGLAERKVIRFLLQPLLENAIYHGIKESSGPCVIAITIRETNGRLRIVVSDDGLGMTQERLGEVRARLEAQNEDLESIHRSIGLPNTNRRIKLAFGEEFGVCIESAPGRGTSVSVEIPGCAWTPMDGACSPGETPRSAS
jgi:two-component system sensor histidine kinase YesM